MSTSYLAGLAVCSHNVNNLAAATFDNVSVLSGPSIMSIDLNNNVLPPVPVTSVTYVFSRQVSLASIAFAMTLNGSPVTFTTTVSNPPGDGMTFVLTFSGTGIVNGTLPAGSYVMSLNAVSVTDNYGMTLSRTTRVKLKNLRVTIR